MHAEPGRAPPTPLARLEARLRPDMERVNALIVERMDSPVAVIPQLAGYLVSSGGKRIRPLMTLAAARLMGYGAGDHHARLAAAVEFIHTATLLHDDVVDESTQRRGKASANEVWGNQASVLVGDFLFSRAFLLMVDVQSVPVLAVLAQASAVIAEGEVLQLTATGDLATDVARYREIIRGKTAALFGAATQVGAMVAGASAPQVAALRQYGEALGIAFQIADDALDYAADQERLGKRVGDDFREGKVTLPVILAYGDGTAAERAFWQRTIGERAVADGDLEHALSLIQRHDAIQRALDHARAEAAPAHAALATLPAGPIAQDLADLIGFAIDRDR